ncbi:MAG: GNAT family N-acetyltransferase, partial [Bdellovibrionales bacterium]|nr:GNAT family N-acetyltransferase [Bdellovibrionales bacterium]
FLGGTLSQELVIQNLQVADVDTIYDLLEQVYQAPEFPLGGAWSRRLLERELDHGRGIGLFREGKLVSLVLYRDQGMIWDIIILATNPAFRRQGEMAHLLKAWLDQRPTGTEVWLEVHELNVAAHSLYKKLGFRQVGSRPAYYRDGASALLFALR